MPYPSQIDREAIVATARKMIEKVGVEKVSLRGIASELGVTATSLYRYVKNKEALLLAINEVTARELVEILLNSVPADASLEEKLMSIAHTYRQFGHDNPATYTLMYSNRDDELRPDENTLEQSVLPIQALFAEWAGQDDSLPALRGAFAILHGWVMLELAGQLRRGGDLNAHFDQSFRAYLKGWK